MKRLWVIVAIGLLVIPFSLGYAAPPILVPGTPNLPDLSNLYPNVKGTWQGSVSMIACTEGEIGESTLPITLEITDQTKGYIVGNSTGLFGEVLMISGYISGRDIHLSLAKARIVGGTISQYLYKFQLDGQLTGGVPLSPTAMKGDWIGFASFPVFGFLFTSTEAGHFTFTRNAP